MRRTVPLLISAILLSSCAASSGPPSVDESTRRPANAAQDLALLGCRTQLHNQQLRMNEQQALSEASRQSLQQCLRVIASPPAASSPLPAGNRIVQIHFGLGSSEPQLTHQALQQLLSAARGAPLIVLKGRTDGNLLTTAEARLARDRAEAVRQALVAAGVDAARIRTTYQPTGDLFANNDDPSARHLNRRVEVEIYQVAPVAMPVPGG